MAGLVADLRDLVAMLNKLGRDVDVVESSTAAVKPKRKYTRKQPAPAVTPVELKDKNWLSFPEAAAVFPMSVQALRRLGRQAEQHLKDPKAGLPSNGFERCIVRIKGSRRIYLDAIELDRWMASGRIAGSQEGGHD